MLVKVSGKSDRFGFICFSNKELSEYLLDRLKPTKPVKQENGRTVDSRVTQCITLAYVSKIDLTYFNSSPG